MPVYGQISYIKPFDPRKFNMHAFDIHLAGKGEVSISDIRSDTTGSAHLKEVALPDDPVAGGR